MNGARPKSNSYANPSATTSGSYCERISNGRGRGNYRNNVPHNQILKQKIYSSVNEFRQSKDNFSGVYLGWMRTRDLTIEKLKNLVEDLHKEQLEFNKAQRACRSVGYLSRNAKCEPETIGTIAGIFALLSDAASGIAAVVQAVNVDEYSEKFKEIMDTDAKATKELYEARSQCVVKYELIEEITRRYPTPTFKSTARGISSDLEVKHLCMAVSNAYQNDDVSKMLKVVGNFIEVGCQLKILEKIGDSIMTYVGENTAALEACDSAVRAARGVFDLVYIDGEKSKAMSSVARVSNQLMIMDDRKQIERLNCMIDSDASQSKLEDKIQDAIYSLEFEMRQIVDAYNKNY